MAFLTSITHSDFSYISKKSNCLKNLANALKNIPFKNNQSKKTSHAESHLDSLVISKMTEYFKQNLYVTN